MKQLITVFLSICLLTASSSKKDFNQPFIKVAKEQKNSIVTVISEKVVRNEMADIPDFFKPFEPWGFGFELPFDIPQERRGKGLGSGVIIDATKGYILTNNHVIDNADKIKVIFHNKEEADAILIGTDPLSDIAIIKVEQKQLKASKMGDSDRLEVGEWVIAIGSPFAINLSSTVTAGIVSAVGRSDVISKMNYEDFIQHDAAINPGNSGGGLFDLDGQLIGINTAIATDGMSRGNAGIGFAIPINQVKRVMDDLIEMGKVLRGWLGVQIQDLDDTMVKALNLKNKKGALVIRVFEDSPADIAGLQDQDVIIKVNGKAIDNTTKLKNIISMQKPEEITRLTIIRENLTKIISIKLGTRPEQTELTSNSYNRKETFDFLGLMISDFSKGYQKGVQIKKIEKGSLADKNEMRIGDIITKIGKQNINNINEYKKELKNYKMNDTIMLRIIRNENPRYIAFEIK